MHDGVGQAPVIAIDGPSASGKGTVAARVAHALGFHYLDSGAIYRALAHAALQRGVALDDGAALAALARQLDLRFDGGETYLDGLPCGAAIRSEEAGRAASRIAALPAVRAALLDRQRSFRRPPGLVTDGRDMGTVVFPDAELKVYLDADVHERARRRYKQLIEKGLDANLDQIEQDLRARDALDAQRASAPLRRSADALLLDTTHMSIDEAVSVVLRWWEGRQPR
ncbi:MAG: (d)CMP kinase [Thiobacillaceae bacterium]|nr:(d)CMP kinase [Thiobacillaceae bacterium]MDW8323352.1 (d)CMP kinase [Burkholderiales bacterium]